MNSKSSLLRRSLAAVLAGAAAVFVGLSSGCIAPSAESTRSAHESAPDADHDGSDPHEPDGATGAAPGQGASASASVAGWTALGDTGAPGEVRRVIPLTQGGYAVLVKMPDSKSAVYKWSGQTGPQEWSLLRPVTPDPPNQGQAPIGDVSDIAEFDGRLYASGPFTWSSGQQIFDGMFSQGVLSDASRWVISMALDASPPQWVAMSANNTLGASPYSDYAPNGNLFLHVVPAGPLRGLYLLGGGLGCSHSGCAQEGNTILRLRPSPNGMAGGLGAVSISSPGGKQARAVAHGAMPLTAGAAPTPVLVVGGLVQHVTDGVPDPRGYGLAAWDGTAWHPVATGIEPPKVVCINQMCDLGLAQSVLGLAFVGTDLYVSGEFATVPPAPNVTDALGPCGYDPLETCQVLNGFALVRDGQWHALRDSRFALPGLAFAGLGSPMGKRLVATNDGVLLLGGPWIPGQIAGATDSTSPLVSRPLGTDDKNGILRWKDNRWDSLQGGTQCAANDSQCSGVVHDVAVVPGRPSFLVAGEFSAVGRAQINAASSNKLALFTPGDEEECVADIDGDGAVSGTDLTSLLSMWGATGETSADLNDDGSVNGSDLTVLLSAWGQCPVGIAPCGAPLVDARDGRSYPTVLVGTQCWMAANLDHGVQISASSVGSTALDDSVTQKLCYANAAANCTMHGGLYEWSEAMQFAPSDPLSRGRTRGACPEGWHIPTDLEVQLLEHALGMTPSDVVGTGYRGTLEGKKLKEGGSTGFDMKLSGRRVAQTNTFSGLDATGGFWTATAATSASWTRQFNTMDKLGRFSTTAVDAYAIRCVRD
ncbi:MAG: hypothetical protein FJ095_08455 [Deltaproteobacteria bacterium]|nr:hypothetical protein [Deltaproteobacteria bacterium]